MRTAKYHDFSALKVVFLLIILVILGLFVYTQFIKPAFFHEAPEDAWVVVEADCENDGVRYKICTDCGKEFDHEVIPALGHNPGNEEVTKEPTCTEDGAGHKACTNCGEILENFTYSALGHKNGEVTVENVIEHTSTQGASYENVVYCTVCNDQVSREKVDVPHVTEIRIIPEVEPTCHTEGSGYVAIFCKDCDKYLEISTELSDIDTTPHPYTWQIVYNKGEFIIISGKCSVDECGHVYDPELDEGYSLSATLNTSKTILPTCVAGTDVYDVDVLYLGMKVDSVTVSVETKPVEEHLILIDDNGTTVALSELAQYDANNRPYYNYSTGLFAVVEPERPDGMTWEEFQATWWDEDGFATAVFYCQQCKKFVQVTVYNDLA